VRDINHNLRDTVAGLALTTVNSPAVLNSTQYKHTVPDCALHEERTALPTELETLKGMRAG
jgi:hypothetical protein